MSSLNHGNAQYLTFGHELVSRVSEIGPENDLAHHLVIYHQVSVQNKTKRQMAWLHLLAHAIMKSDEAKERLGVNPRWGQP